MTVENIKNKMSPLQMGVTAEFPFNFAVLLQDPTEEEALKAIKAKVALANGEEIELVYGTDYTVELNTDRLGGTLTVKNLRTTGDYITIYRQYEQTQEVDYRDFNSAPAETFEQCFDKLTMLSQQQQEEIDRSLKFSVSSTSINPSLPEPLANNTLIWNEEGTDFKNYDIIGENNAFKADVNFNIAQGQTNIQTQLDTFEAEQIQQLEQFKTEQTEAFDAYREDINQDIETVLEAADRVNELEDSVALALTSAEAANTAAQDAITAANNATNVLATTANKDLSNLSEEGENKFVKTDELVEVSIANQDLSNLTETGEKHFLGKSQITNCITEIPQRIKYTLENGTLTIKAGSVVIVPYKTEDLTAQYPVGSKFIKDWFKVCDTQFTDGKFFVWAELTEDKTLPITTSSTAFTKASVSFNFSANTESSVFGWADKQASGTVTSTVASTLYYQTNNNTYLWQNTGTEYMSLPILQINHTANSGIVTIEQVFNGMGYIGSTVWVDKGVKGLMPNGRNEDGSLKNIEIITDKIIMRTSTGAGTNMGVVFNQDDVTWRTYLEQEEQPAVVSRWFDINNNLMKQNSTSDVNSWSVVPYCYLGVATFTANGQITSFKPKTTFRAVDYNEFSNEFATIDNNKVGYPNLTAGVTKSWDTQYTADQNGWVRAGATVIDSASDATITVDGVSFVAAARVGGTAQYGTGFIPVPKGGKYKATGGYNNKSIIFYPCK